MRKSILVVVLFVLFWNCESGAGRQEVLADYIDSDVKEDFFKYKGKNMNGQYLIKYDDGRYTYGTFKDGRPVDTLKSYHPNKQLRKLAPFTPEGVHEGDEVWFYNDGSLWTTRTYVNGNREGEEIVYYKGEKDKVNVISVYSHDRLTNKKEFYKDGSLKYEMINDTLESFQSQKKYFVNGNLQSVKQYKNGLQEGVFIEYNENGTKKKAMIFKNGDLLKEIQYDAAGNVNQTLIY